MSAREALTRALWDNYTAAEKDAFIDAHRDEVALEIGRDALRNGLASTLIRLVGEVNATKLLADHRGAVAHELAEQIRDERPQWGDAWRHYGEAADLIDPKAQKP
jgi:hypothetical protein